MAEPTDRDREMARAWLARPDPNSVSLMCCPHVNWAPKPPGDCEECLADLIAAARAAQREEDARIVEEISQVWAGQPYELSRIAAMAALAEVRRRIRGQK